MPRHEAQNNPTQAGSLCLPTRAIEILAAATARLIDASAHAGVLGEFQKLVESPELKATS